MPQPELRRQVAKALLSRGLWLEGSGRFEKAYGVCCELLARFSELPEPAREDLAGVLTNIATSFEEADRWEDAVAVYDEIDKHYGEAKEANIRALVARAVFLKGAGAARLRRGGEALRAFDEVISRFGCVREPAFDKWLAFAMYNKALVLTALRRVSDALAAYSEIESRFENVSEPEIRDLVMRAREDRVRCETV
jgi:tetratricopeptide (TPR) repeat protein